MELKMEVRYRTYDSNGKVVWNHYVNYIIENPHDAKYRYKTSGAPGALDNWAMDNAMAHLERIVNGIEGESGVLLYVNDDVHVIKFLARMILEYGRESILLTYYPDGYQNWKRLPEEYPYVDNDGKTYHHTLRMVDTLYK